jgi:hypothetical protein
MKGFDIMKNTLKNVLCVELHVMKIELPYDNENAYAYFSSEEELKEYEGEMKKALENYNKLRPRHLYIGFYPEYAGIKLFEQKEGEQKYRKTIRDFKKDLKRYNVTFEEYVVKEIKHRKKKNLPIDYSLFVREEDIIKAKRIEKNNF